MSEIRKFNRHASMNAETRRGILELIHDLVLADTKTWNIQNMLYGFFDGFDYSQVLPEHVEMKELEKVNFKLYASVLGVCSIVSKYPDGFTEV